MKIKRSQCSTIYPWADLKRLAHLVNIDGENEEIIKLSFVMGLPNKVSAQLRATPKIDTLDLTAILQISRALINEIFKSDLIEVGAVARSNTSADADADACDEKLRSWRQKSANCALLDLRDAYMQISVADECSKHQT